MRIELLIWSFFILCLVVHSACEITSTPKTGDHGPLKQHDQLKHEDLYDMMMTKSSRKGHQRTYGRIHQVHRYRISQKIRPPITGGASDLKHPRNTNHNAASSVLFRPPTLFVSFGLLIFYLY